MGPKELRRHLPCIISIKLRLPIAAHNKHSHTHTHTNTLATHCTNTAINGAEQMTARCQNKINARPAKELRRKRRIAFKELLSTTIRRTHKHTHTRTRIDNNKRRALSFLLLSLSLSHPFRTVLKNPFTFECTHKKRVRVHRERKNSLTQPVEHVLTHVRVCVCVLKG